MQSHFVTVAGGSRSVEYFADLQPLLPKDGPTIATAFIDTVKQVMGSCSAGLVRNVGGANRIRIVHLVIGNGINRNDNALKRVYHYFKKSCTELPIRY